MRNRIEKIPDQQDFEALLQAADELNNGWSTEWVTVLRLAWLAGIQPWKARFLRWDDLQNGYFLLREQDSEQVLRRALPPELLSILEKLPRDQSFVFPKLQAMPTGTFGDTWRLLCRHAGVKFASTCLVWPYRNQNKISLNWEKSQGYLEALANRYLNPEQIQRLKTDSAAWFSKPAKKGNRTHRLTRQEHILRGKSSLN
jgi:hypothetical protein